jgi:hypothetical protein
MSKERELLKAIDRNGRINGECLPAHLADALQEVLSQPEQEPVAWKDRTYGNLHAVNYGNSIPLYTAPQTREPLSDAEIMRLGVLNCCNEANAFKPFGFARAIEKAHGIGNKMGETFETYKECSEYVDKGQKHTIPPRPEGRGLLEFF